MTLEQFSALAEELGPDGLRYAMIGPGETMYTPTAWFTIEKTFPGPCVFGVRAVCLHSFAVDTLAQWNKFRAKLSKVLETAIAVLTYVEKTKKEAGFHEALEHLRSLAPPMPPGEDGEEAAAEAEAAEALAAEAAAAAAAAAAPAAEEVQPAAAEEESEKKKGDAE